MVNECSCKGFNNMTLQKKLLSVGNYKFSGKKLGKGNFARVEEAVHTVLNVKVAVKIMDVTQIKEDYIIRNLHREARIMSQLRHPCIAALFQTMQNGSVYYLVTELIGGGDLCTFIKTQRYGKLDERNTRVYARQLISALAHMHNLGIVHRDLKMENVMMNSMQTQIKIVDFGLSNAYDPSSPLRTHCGSPEYAAPELFVPSKSYGPEVDLWSLGVILFGMVAGQLPFVTNHEDNVSSQERRKRLLVQINKGYSNNQRKILSAASTDFKAMISRMLIADAPKRITINELLFHVWVTDKGRKCVITNPMKKLGDEWQISIMKQTGNLMHLDWTTVKFARSTEPHGDVAGVYNILAYKLQDDQLEGDGVTKTVHPQHNIVLNDKKDSSVCLPSRVPVRKRIERVKSSSAHKMQKVSADNTPRIAPVKRSQLTIEKRPQTTNLPVHSVHTRKVKDTVTGETSARPKAISTETRNRLQSAAEKHIKQQLHYLKEQFMAPPSEGFARVVSAYLPKPRKCASTTNATQRPPLQTAVRPKIQRTGMVSKPNALHPPAISASSKNEVHIAGSKGLANVLLKKKPTPKTCKASPKSSRLNADTVIIDRSKSISVTTERRAMTANFTQQMEKAIRFMPVTRNPNDSVATTNSSLRKSLPIHRPSQRPRTTVKAQPNVVEQSALAHGDVLKRRSSSTSTKAVSDRKTILSDPIARSIVGYLVKTLPAKPEAYKLKKNTRPKTSSAV